MRQNSMQIVNMFLLPPTTIPTHSPQNAKKPQIWPVSWSQNGTKNKKSTNHDLNLISSEDRQDTVYTKKYAHGFVVLCFVVVMQLFIMNSHEVFIHIHQGCFAGTGAIVRLPQCQWSKPDGYGKISQCITTTKHSKAKTLCIFLGIYCTSACPIAGHFSHTFSKKCSEPLRTDRWTEQCVGWWVIRVMVGQMDG